MPAGEDLGDCQLCKHYYVAAVGIGFGFFLKDHSRKVERRTEIPTGKQNGLQQTSMMYTCSTTQESGRDQRHYPDNGWTYKGFNVTSPLFLVLRGAMSLEVLKDLERRWA